MKVQLLRLDYLTPSDRIYPITEFTKERVNEEGNTYTEIDRLSKEELYGQYGYGDVTETNPLNASHYISNTRIEDDWIVGDLTILNSNLEAVVDSLVFGIRAIGIVEDNKVQLDSVITFDVVER